ncbi:MAG TPA: molybdopterin molybdotransferase MoeA [Desulfomonilaceae bacterium]|nr:molybdopterin molybdotransferase MoeA [Desulfomonilaceae bacterium]
MNDISFLDAVRLSQANVVAMNHEVIPVNRAVGRVAAREVRSVIDSPSADVSVKDGYAVISDDLATASANHPVFLQVVSTAAAGDNSEHEVSAGLAVRVLSGALLPKGANAVLAEEFTLLHGGLVEARANSHVGRNILTQGEDVQAGEMLAKPNQELTPTVVGLMVAGGVTEVEVFRRPKVSLLGIGDEVLLPGMTQRRGAIYASNLALQEAWLLSHSLPSDIKICGDSFQGIAESVDALTDAADVLVTSGGAWKSERDLIVKVLESLGWEILFHRVRMGPGKAVAMARRRGKAVFCLPGGPPSNEAAFLTIVLPAILRMSGSESWPYPKLYGRLSEELTGQKDWTQIVHCGVLRDSEEFSLEPLRMKRRLISMARAGGLCLIPEGTERIPAGSMVPFFCIDKTVLAASW